MRRSIWRFYFSYFRGSRGELALGIVSAIVRGLAALPVAWLVQYALDDVIPSGDTRLLVVTGLAILALTAFMAAAAVWTARKVLSATTSATQALRLDLLRRCLALSRSYFSQADLGELRTHILWDTEHVTRLGRATFSGLLPAVVISAGFSAVLLHSDWILFLLVAVAASILAVSLDVVRRRLEASHAQVRRGMQAFNKGVQVTLRTMDLVKLQAAEEIELADHAAVLGGLRASVLSREVIRATHTELSNVMVTVPVVLILVIGGLAVGSGTMTTGELLSFFVVFGMLSSYLRRVWSVLPGVVVGYDSLKNVAQFMRVDDVPPYTGQRHLSFQGKITLEGVHFAYGDEPVLRGADISIEPASTVAIIGPNGSGKSTVLNLILGFYRPQTGQVLVDDIPMDELDVIDLRRQMGVVMQDPLLFPGTIEENIAYGSPDASHNSIAQAAEIATAHEFIRELPDGYDTYIGEEGMLLSGGQRQRIALARALLRRPGLLILDEPANHLDEAAVSDLMRNLKSLDYTPTILLISHDMSVVREAERVYVMQDGRIVAQRASEGLPARAAPGAGRPTYARV